MATDRRPEELAATDYRNGSLYDFIASAPPPLDPPYHLDPLVRILDAGFEAGNVRAAVGAPPQHGKTTTVVRAIVRRLLKYPKRRLVYCTNAAHLSQLRSRDMRRLFLACGGVMGEMNTIAQWQTKEGGGLLATSIDGQLVGQPADDMIFDDLYKNREEAESAEKREQVDDFCKSVAFPRLWPGGSMLLIATRWHEDDQSGRLIRRGWQEVNMPAITTREDGTELALWPDVKPLEFLKRLRDPGPDCIGVYDWEAQYQGNPRPKGVGMFRADPTYYAQLPIGPQRTIVGCDLAYTAGSRADFAVALAITLCGGMLYVRELDRRQQGIIEVEEMIRGQARLFPNARRVTYYAGPEKAVLALLGSKGLPVEGMPARYSKAVRAYNTAQAWNAGRILLPEGAAWVPAFVSELKNFSGREGERDDQVDALVSGHDALAGAGVAAPRMFGSRRI